MSDFSHPPSSEPEPGRFEPPADRPSYDPPSFEQPTYQQPDYAQPDYPQARYQQPGFDQQNYPNRQHPDPQPGSFQPTGEIVELPPERVGRGSLLALVAVPIGMIVAALIWQVGFIASISTLVMAALLPILYRRGSGGRIRKGIPVIIGLAVIGTVLSFFAVVTGDLIKAYQGFGPGDRASYGSFAEFWSTNIFYGPVLKSYSKDAALFVLFAVLAGVSVILRVRRMNRANGASR